MWLFKKRDVENMLAAAALVNGCQNQPTRVLCSSQPLLIPKNSVVEFLVRILMFSASEICQCFFNAIFYVHE